MIEIWLGFQRAPQTNLLNARQLTFVAAPADVAILYCFWVSKFRPDVLVCTHKCISKVYYAQMFQRNHHMLQEYVLRVRLTSPLRFKVISSKLTTWEEQLPSDVYDTYSRACSRIRIYWDLCLHSAFILPSWVSWNHPGNSILRKSKYHVSMLFALPTLSAGS